MVKIIFEVSEESINEGACPNNAIASLTEDGSLDINVLLSAIGFNRLKKQVKKGKKEFIVTPDKLDKKSNELYDIIISDICLLAALSETDKENKPSDEE